MYSHLALIKVGGSFITDKATPFTAIPESIKLFAEQFAEVYNNNPDTDFILGNGVGSFAHGSARTYDLHGGQVTPNQFYGMAVTHSGARHINNMVADALLTQNVPAYGLSPSGFMLYQNAELTSSYFAVISELLANRSVPLLHGDTMMDTAPGTTIASTETILQICLEYFRKTYERITVIYIMQTNGVLDANGKTIIELNTSDEIHTLEQIGHDVTGSITGKVASARKAAELADAVYLISGSEPRTLQAALNNKSVGTQISR
jgi:isopentenyl phosphate kinase